MQGQPTGSAGQARTVCLDIFVAAAPSVKDIYLDQGQAGRAATCTLQHETQQRALYSSTALACCMFLHASATLLDCCGTARLLQDRCVYKVKLQHLSNLQTFFCSEVMCSAVLLYTCPARDAALLCTCLCPQDFSCELFQDSCIGFRNGEGLLILGRHVGWVATVDRQIS